MDLCMCSLHVTSGRNACLCKCAFLCFWQENISPQCVVKFGYRIDHLYRKNQNPATVYCAIRQPDHAIAKAIVDTITILIHEETCSCMRSNQNPPHHCQLIISYFEIKYEFYILLNLQMKHRKTAFCFTLALNQTNIHQNSWGNFLLNFDALHVYNIQIVITDLLSNRK